MKKLLLILMLLIPITIFAANNDEKTDNLILKSCVDGDTAKFRLDDKIVTVRFLAIDTPETVKRGTAIQPYGKEASNYTCDSLKNADTIEIEYDDNSDRYDKYNRLLGWIFIDDELLQNKLVLNGYAKVAYLYGDYKYTDKLKESEIIAKTKNLNIWNDQSKISDYMKIIILFIFIMLLYILKKYQKKAKRYGLFKKIIKQYKRNLNL